VKCCKCKRTSKQNCTERSYACECRKNARPCSGCHENCCNRAEGRPHHSADVEKPGNANAVIPPTGPNSVAELRRPRDHPSARVHKNPTMTQHMHSSVSVNTVAGGVNTTGITHGSSPTKSRIINNPGNASSEGSIVPPTGRNSVEEEYRRTRNTPRPEYRCTRWCEGSCW